MKKKVSTAVEAEKIPVSMEEQAPALAGAMAKEGKGTAPDPAPVETVEERLSKLETILEGLEKGRTTVDHFMALRHKTEAEKATAHEAMVARLKQQEQEAKQLYPKLSLREEAKDPRFVDLLKCGLDVRSAFEVIHKDEIIAASMEYAAREVERMMTNKILAGALRPGENGGNPAPAVTKPDVKSMTRQERKDMIRRVSMGEKITL